MTDYLPYIHKSQLISRYAHAAMVFLELSTSRCGHCRSASHLRRCSRCKVQHYCSSEHQKKDFERHKSACRNVFKAFQHMQAEEQKLRNHPGDPMTPADVFSNSVGHFWGILETRPYMRTRWAYIEKLAGIDTRDSVVTQLDYVVECLRLCRRDNMNVRAIAPHLMIRLDQDQEAYDFVKWYQMTGSEDDYDWDDLTLGFLDVHGADCFEDADYLCNDYVDLSHLVAAVLVKVKIVLDLIALKNSVGGENDMLATIPGNVLNNIRQHSVRSPVVKANKQIMDRSDQSDCIQKVAKQVKTLYQVIERNNHHFWPTLLSPGANLLIVPECYSRGELSEVQFVMKFVYKAWTETAGAIEVVKSMIVAEIPTR